MSATDELRRLLDERGVKHYDGWRGGEIRYTKWQGIGNMCFPACFLAHDSFGTDDELLYVQGINMTPAQAIAATLGPGTCSDNNTEYDMFCCSECKCRLRLYDYDDEPTLTNDFIATTPNFCPICGAKVVDNDNDR